MSWRLAPDRPILIQTECTFLKWPKDGNENGNQDRDKEIEGQAKFEVDTEAVPPWPFNVKDQDRCNDPV